MLAPVRAELLKFFTTRLWWGMAIAVFLTGAAFAALFGYALTAVPLGTDGTPTGTPTQLVNTVYTGGLSMGYLLLLTIGILQIGSEYRHKTISSTFLTTPRRVQAMLAKVVALLGVGVFYGVVSLAGSVSVGAAVLTSRGFNAFPSADVGRTLALSLLVLGLWALIGLGIGILFPNQVAALLIGVGIAWIVEPLLSLALTFLWSWGKDNVVPYMPSQATNAVVNAVVQGGTEAAPRLSWWVAALVLIGWAAVLSGFGIWRTARQDIA